MIQLLTYEDKVIFFTFLERMIEVMVMVQQSQWSWIVSPFYAKTC
jgi:hypothetical protein